ncbi:hypothetical protein AB0C59_12825 [Streptomyces sp. NPDC048664]|uniref:hypothetical protein n=1 Tax=Streptomyces sp. NPDC048664 TaxID=3154505 RepID=UPI003423D357
MDSDRRRPDAVDLGAAGCGWLLIVAVASLPGMLLDDGEVTAYLAVVGALIGLPWARGRLRR